MSVTHLTAVEDSKVTPTGQGLLDLDHLINEDNNESGLPVSDQIDALARTNAAGETYWSARALLPLLGYTQWSTFITIMTRTRRLANNTGMDATFSPATRTAGRGEGSEQSDWHLNAMAAFLVTMSSDPYKPEVAAAQEYFTMHVRHDEMAANDSLAAAIYDPSYDVYDDAEPTTSTDQADMAAAVTAAVTAAMAPVMTELTTLSERVARLESAPAPAEEKEAAPAKPAKPEPKKVEEPKALSLSKWRTEYLPEVRRTRLFDFLVAIGAMELTGTRPGGEGANPINMYEPTELGKRHGLEAKNNAMYVTPGREQDLKDFIESLQL